VFPNTRAFTAIIQIQAETVGIMEVITVAFVGDA